MAITKKNLIAFVFTILFVISYVHCRSTSDIVSGTGWLFCYFYYERNFIIFM